MIRGWTQSDHQPLREKLPFKQKFSHVMEIVHTYRVITQADSVSMGNQQKLHEQNYRLTMENGQNYWYLI